MGLDDQSKLQCFSVAEKFDVLLEFNSHQGSSSLGAHRPAEAPVWPFRPLRPQRPWVCAYYGEKSGRVQSEFVHDGSVKHPYTFSCPPHTAAPTKRPDAQTGGRHTRGQDAAGGGGALGGRYWLDVYCTWREKRADGAFLTRLTLNQSHQTFSQGTPDFFLLPFTSFPSPFSLPPALRCICSPFHFYSVKGKSERERERGKNKVDKGCPPSSGGGRGIRVRWERVGVRGGVQIALQKTGLRAEISHNAADKKVGHITFGGHVTGMQMADSVVTGRKMLPLPLPLPPPPPSLHLKDEGEGGEVGVRRRR